MHWSIQTAYDCQEEVIALFREYTDMLVATDPAAADQLRHQDYHTELEHLLEKYGPPGGRLYLARVDGQSAGCAALHRLDEARCELKRLYVRPQFRGHGLAEQLVRQILQDAAHIGYSCILLDTFPFLTSALHLYRKLGFYDVPSYNGPPMDGLLYLRRDLDTPSQAR